MDITFLYVLIFATLGGVLSLAGAALLLTRERLTHKIGYYATPFAAGALLAAVFLDLLAEGFEASKAPNVVLYGALAGILMFFFAERFLRWFHHHHQHENAGDPTVPLVIAGDTIHNALDGVAIAAAFLVSIPTGIVTALAVAAHEIPQEIGDFGLLLKKGVRRRNVMLVNLLSALATVVAAAVTYTLGDADKLPTAWLLGLSAGFLLYIALSDIIPLIHEDADPNKLFDKQSALLIAGLLTVAVSIQLAHTFIDVEHSEGHEQSSQAMHLEEKSHFH